MKSFHILQYVCRLEKIFKAIFQTNIWNGLLHLILNQFGGEPRVLEIEMNLPLAHCYGYAKALLPGPLYYSGWMQKGFGGDAKIQVQPGRSMKSGAVWKKMHEQSVKSYN